jgi:ABC-type nitrate/sulfonate/bicarbonate transport system ATPase subunit
MNACTRGDVLLSINHVSLSFGDRVVLRDVNAEIRDVIRPDRTQGQIICFLGPSGIGKTQLSRVIAGLQAPTRGNVLLEEARPVRAGLVGMVPQNYPLFEFATVAENFRIAARQAGDSDAVADQKAAQYVDVFDLAPHLHDYPSALSGGTRQRVAIVRQLLCAGHYLVLDEPFSGLDPLMKQHAADVIVRVANLDERNTIIIVTHDILQGCSVADTVWLMGREADQPGAQLVEQFDLAAMGLCWRDDILQAPEFLAFVAMLTRRFATLSTGRAA